jgi:hypothetical protein
MNPRHVKEDIFLKFKAEASGYPGWMLGPEDQNRYVQYFRGSEGIELDKTAIQKNAALSHLILGHVDGIE